MNRLLMVGFVLLFSITFGTITTAEEKKEKSKHEAGGHMHEKGKTGGVAKKFAGKVVSFDEVTKTLVVKRNKTEETFDASGTKLASNTKLEELKADERVAIKYVEKDGKKIATAIARAPKKGRK